ncbi:hypothetical protein ACFC09_01420 [Streptomyces sp. NPDC056161]|uniref:hypothetical protein n=1 Tax=Streptomyces sp. NPDC056161 TaxID=3345732 RepID=UPI0035DF6824
MTAPSALPTMREATYDTGRQKIFAAEAGDGPAVLLLHGGGPGTDGVSSYVRNIAASCAPSGRRTSPVISASPAWPCPRWSSGARRTR